MSEELHDLAAPYALHALPAQEEAEFEAHLRRCPDCRSEVASLQDAAARMGADQPLAPGTHLRDRVLAALDSTPQQARVVELSPRRAGRWVPRFLVAAALVAALGSVGVAVKERQEADDLRAARDEMSALMTAPDAFMGEKALPGGGTVRMIGSRSEDRLVLATMDLPEVSGHSYQLWTMKSGRPTSQGILTAGHGMRLLEGLAGADMVAITMEPTGGSELPTTDPIMASEI